MSHVSAVVEDKDGGELDLREVGVLDIAFLALCEAVERPDGVLPLLNEKTESGWYPSLVRCAHGDHVGRNVCLREAVSSQADVSGAH